MLKEISILTSSRVEFVDITERVSAVIKETKVENGFCVLFVPHTTAGITINENADPSVISDISKKLNKLIPEDENYSHSEGNSDAHIKSTLVGNSLYLIIENKRLKLGTWQGVYFCEFDGPRHRKIWMKIVPG